jgi:amino acid permease
MTLRDKIYITYPYLGAFMVYEFLTGGHGLADFFKSDTQKDNAAAWALFTFGVIVACQNAHQLILSILTELRAIRSAIEKIAQNSN